MEGGEKVVGKIIDEVKDIVMTLATIITTFYLIKEHRKPRKKRRK
jgi:hypothetical protein